MIVGTLLVYPCCLVSSQGKISYQEGKCEERKCEERERERTDENKQ